MIFKGINTNNCYVKNLSANQNLEKVDYNFKEKILGNAWFTFRKKNRFLDNNKKHI